MIHRGNSIGRERCGGRWVPLDSEVCLSWESGEIEQRRGGLCRFCNFSATTKTFSYQFTKTKRKNSLKAINCAPIVTEKTTKFKT